jgi:hypothetical protein
VGVEGSLFGVLPACSNIEAGGVAPLFLMYSILASTATFGLFKKLTAAFPGLLLDHPLP